MPCRKSPIPAVSLAGWNLGKDEAISASVPRCPLFSARFVVQYLRAAVFSCTSDWTSKRRCSQRPSTVILIEPTARFYSTSSNNFAPRGGTLSTMSLPFLSRQDVERWVPEPAPSKGGSCFVAKLFTTISRVMASLASVLSVTKDETHRRCRNEVERFFLWGQGLSIFDGDLDEVLARSKELHFRVLSLLLRLGTAVLQGLSRDSAPPSLVLTEQCEDLRTLLDATEAMLQDPESDDPARPYTPSGSDASEYGSAEIVEEISIYVDCLLDLSPALDNPALDIQEDGAKELPTRAKESFNASSEEALIYCRKIRDRFEVLPTYLVERLAEANVIRALALREMRSRPSKHDAPFGDGFTESLFSTTDRRVTERTKSTAPSSSVFSSLRWSKAPSSTSKLNTDDNASEATFASFSTASSAASLGRPRVPQMPEVQQDGFDCPICFLRVTNVKTREEWKSVTASLRPRHSLTGAGNTSSAI